ncbi:MAG: hypothetical protein WCF68_07270 [Terriglobales bacterium]
MTNSTSTRAHDHTEHLAQVHALSQAVASAIAAIEKNNLPQLEAHLAEQETICHRLAAKIPDAPLPPELRQAYLALAQRNQVYASLLKRARKSAALMSVFYRSQGAGQDPSQRHTWSCEV